MIACSSQSVIMAAKSFQFFCDNPRLAPGVAELDTTRDKPFELCLQLHQVSCGG
jgi:hypothetical protein